MSKIVTIERGTTALYIYCLRSGRLAENESVSIFKFLQQYLTEYEFNYQRKISTAKYSFYLYDYETNVLYLPINIQEQLENYFKQNLVQYKVVQLPPIKYTSININNLGVYKDRANQIGPINFVIQPGMRALELQTGCITGDSEIFFKCKRQIRKLTIEEAYHLYLARDNFFTSLGFVPKQVQAYNDRNIIFHDIEKIFYSGVKKVLKLTFRSGRTFRCTYDHLLLTEIGWIEARHTLNQEILATSDSISLINIPFLFYDGVISIEDDGCERTFDIQCKDPYHNFVANGIVVHNSGKTYVAARAITEIKARTLIVVPASLMKQWYESLTIVSDAKIGVIKGSKTIYDIINKDYDVDIDVFLGSVNTLREYARKSSHYDVLPPLDEFVHKLGIGIKIIDECHVNFNANLLIDIACGNIIHNIYLSATYIRSSRTSNTIFNRIFTDDIKFDNGTEYNRYVNITELNYSFGPIDDKKVSTDKGYSQFKYEKLLLKGKRELLHNFINNILFRAMEEFYINIKDPGEKLLILVGMEEFAGVIVNNIHANYPQFVTTTFVYKTAEEELEKSDIIVSTIGSCGTGRDIPGLRSMILFPSFSSEALVLQTPGRLRRMKNTPEFVYLVNRGISAHRRHAAQKLKTYQFIGKTFKSITF